jgi:hypothetical protein
MSLLESEAAETLYHASALPPYPVLGYSSLSDQPAQGMNDTETQHAKISEFFNFEGFTLISSGIILDKVADIEPVPEIRTFTHSNPLKQMLDFVTRHCHNNVGVSAIESEDLATALGSMLVGECSGSVTLLIELGDPNWVTFHRLTSLQEEERDFAWSDKMYSMIDNRQLIFTERGYMGFAPLFVETEFEVAILLGCSVLVLLERIKTGGRKSKEVDSIFVETASCKDGWRVRC